MLTADAEFAQKVTTTMKIFNGASELILVDPIRSSSMVFANASLDSSLFKTFARDAPRTKPTTLSTTHAAAVPDTLSLMETAYLLPVVKIKSTLTKNRSVFAISDTTLLTEFAIDAPRAKFTTAKVNHAKTPSLQFADSTSIGTNAAASASWDMLEYQESALSAQ